MEVTMFANLYGETVGSVAEAMDVIDTLLDSVSAQALESLSSARTMEDLYEAAKLGLVATELGAKLPESLYLEAESEVRRGDRLQPDTLVAFITEGGDISIKAMQCALSPRERMVERRSLPHRMVIGNQEFVGYVVEG